MRICFLLSLVATLAGFSPVTGFTLIGFAQHPDVLRGTELLRQSRPLDEVMVEGIDRFALRAIEEAAATREQKWNADFRSIGSYNDSLLPLREEFAKLIGAVDLRVAFSGFELVATTTQPSMVAENPRFTIHRIRWPVLEGVHGEGLLLQPRRKAIARIIAVPDADWTPEMIAGLQAAPSPDAVPSQYAAPSHFATPSQYAAHLASFGCEVVVPTLISRDSSFSGNADIQRSTNLTHREFIYRQAFELGRHVIGYEVQKVLAAIDEFERRNRENDLPLGVIGVGEGGLLALHSAAIDPRIDFAVVSGYFDQRQKVWQEPIYRNVWKQLQKFGDAELAGMIAPRSLFIEMAPSIPTVSGPPESTGRNVAAPGSITALDPQSVAQEIRKAKSFWDRLDTADRTRDEALGKLLHSEPELHGQNPLQAPMLWSILKQFTAADGSMPEPSMPETTTSESAEQIKLRTDARQQRQVAELTKFTQRLLRDSHRVRDRFFARLDRRSVEAFVDSAAPVRDEVYEQLIGKLPTPSMPPEPRSRKVMETNAFTGYEIVLDVYPDIIAAGILLLPNDLTAGEKRPVVVCQHGLEGTPEQTIGGPDTEMYRAYKGFAAELARRGFIVYAPQNPYRGQDAFRTLQRKSNPLGRSLFSYIIPQHLVTLRWLSQHPNVDPQRIGFYGLSYGGKTAVRVPPMLPPGDDEPGYCLSICSADFNEWVAKNASVDAPFSYLWTGEYEIFEWNMGHIANYAELAMLMTPRPFMVERGHDDGVGIDEWVAWEYAKVRRHYNKLGLGDRTEIEYFDGPHTINGQGTYDFLHRHLDWPAD